MKKNELLGKKVILKSEIDIIKYKTNASITKDVSVIIFEGKLISGDGTLYTAVGLENQGELVLDCYGNLILFPWINEDGDVLHNFEAVNETCN